MTSVSILTVVRNAAAHLPRCLIAVANQGYRVQHVIQDGGSTDGTRMLIRGYRDAVSEDDTDEHGDIQVAFSRGLARCTGDVVGFSWADEALTPDAVRRAVRYLDDNVEVHAIYGGVMETDAAWNDTGERHWPDWNRQSVLEYRLVPPLCATFIRRRFIDDHFWPLYERAGFDCFEWVLYLSLDQVRRVDDVFSRYMRHAGQLSHRPDVVNSYPKRVLAVAERLGMEPAIVWPQVREWAHWATGAGVPG